jgi:CheY-like chemotaxis protein
VGKPRSRVSVSAGRGLTRGPIDPPDGATLDRGWGFSSSAAGAFSFAGAVEMSDNTRVLIVDDDPAFLQSFAQSLAHEGLDVHTATDAGRALAAARETSPHCVLLDILLPDIDGRELARQLREEHGCALVLIAVTGGGPQISALNTDMKAIDHVLRKPVDIAELRKLLALGPHA